ncbi:MAG: HD domain-containing protein [Deltaproteobacteria bacterium]|nr:HD domain-containing protein [Deltaproteobacteria bacterium]
MTSQLRPGMTIHGILNFSSEYSMLDSELVGKINQEFNGARAEVKRKSQGLTIPVAELKPFDELICLLDIPKGWPGKEVTPELIQALQKRGFRGFEVSGEGREIQAAQSQPAQSQPAQPAPAAPAVNTAPGDNGNGARRVENAKKMLDGLEKASAIKAKSMEAVQDMMNNGRMGRFSTAGVMSSVSSILENDSTQGIQALAGLKESDQTYTHCVDVAAILMDIQSALSRMARKDVTAKEERFLLLAGFMHDIGKTRIPKDILESTERFSPDSKEMQVIRGHVDHSARILTGMGLDGITINIAQYHHVKYKNWGNTSYPRVSYDQLHHLTRLVSIIDVYQALIAHRSYKPGFSPAKAVKIIAEGAGKDYDEGVARLFFTVIGRYPLGSMVKLSSGDIAFVVGVATKVPDRPIVVIYENAQGEVITHHEVVDLMGNVGVKVVEPLDPFEFFKDRDVTPYDAFMSLNV